MSDEYAALLAELVSTTEAELLPYTRALYLFGSYQKEEKETGWIIPGQSDIDLVLVVDLDDPNPDKPQRRLRKISEILSAFLCHPSYSSILDLSLIEYGDLPQKIGMTFSPLHLYSAAKGRLVLGKNILNDFSYSPKVIKQSAAVLCYQTYENLKASVLNRPIIGTQNLAFISADCVLEMAHAYLAFKGNLDEVRTHVPDSFSNLMNDNNNTNVVDTVFEAHKWRLGTQKQNKGLFIRDSIEFCHTILQNIRDPFESL